MFQIDYSLISEYVVEKELIPSISGDDLRYNYFCGDVEFINGQSSFIADCNWVTLLDFALCMVLIRKNMIVRGEGKYVFELETENQSITFRYHSGEVTIIPSFSLVSMTVPWEDFNKALKKFIKTLTLDILDNNEEILSNNAFYYYMNFASHLD